MEKKNILIMTDIGFSQRDYDRFGIDRLKPKYETLILDFTEWFSPKYWEAYPEKTFKCDGYLKVSNQNQFEESVKNKDFLIAIDFFSSSKKTNLIRNFLREKKIKITKFRSGLTIKMNRTFSENLYKIFFLFLSPKKLLKKFMNFFNKDKNSIFSYDYVVIGGKEGLNDSIAKKSKKIIKGHSWDYDIFLKINDVKNNSDLKPYAVFLDQCLPFHPTAAFRGENPKATKENYYPALNNFFETFEKKTGLEVVFAAHPRSRYDLYPEHLYNRKCFFNKTAELVKNSKIVLLHTTTSLSFAVLFKKPTIFLTSDEIKKSYDDFKINSYSREMNSPLFNIDDKNNFNKINNSKNYFSFDQEKYQEYFEKYLKFPGSPDNFLWNILLDNFSDTV